MFMHLLNDIYRDAHGTGNELHLILLPIGFSVFLFIEQHLYRVRRDELRIKELELAHSFISMLTGLAIGLTLAVQLQAELFDQLFLVAVFILYDMIDIITLHSLHHHHLGHTMRNKARKLFFAMGPIYGYAIGLVIHVSRSWHLAVMTFLSGMVLHAVLNEIMPEEKDVKPGYFILGILVFLTVYLFDILLIRSVY